MHRPRPILPLALLTALILVPVAVVTVAGVVLLRHERDRLESKARNANQRWLGQVAGDLEFGLRNLRDDLLEELTSLPSDGRVEALNTLREEHPLVRNVFLIRPGEDRILPPSGLHMDTETRRFLQRYSSLFEERTPWFPPRPDLTRPDPYEEPESYRLLKSFRGAPKKGKSTTEKSVRMEWRHWQWEDRNGILLYLEDTNTRETYGIELEMSALFSRLDVLLRSLARPGTPLIMVNRQERVVLASEEAENPLQGTRVEVGPLLPFARLITSPDGQTDGTGGRIFALTAGGVGVLLLTSILGGTLGLTAWVRRSRRDALRKTSFVSNVSHEFKTPLTTLRLYSELLLEDRVPDPEKRKRYLKTLRDESERLARLVHNALDFSRLEMGRGRLHPESLSLKERIQGVLERLSERMEAATFSVQLPETDIRILADPDGSDQLILNLVDNALKYAGKGRRLDIQWTHQDGYAEIRFHDRGPGIPPRERNRIFKAFHQVDDRITRQSGGTGLGLHISRRMARHMDGDLTLNDSETGACFVWTIPVAEGEPV